MSGLDRCVSSVPNGMLNPDRSARTESLYRLRFFENVCTLDLYRKFRLRTPPHPHPRYCALGWDFVTATATNQPKESVKQNVSDFF